MATKTATGPNGEKLTYKSATGPNGETRWFRVDTPEFQDPANPIVQTSMSPDPVPQPETPKYEETGLLEFLTSTGTRIKDDYVDPTIKELEDKLRGTSNAPVEGPLPFGMTHEDIKKANKRNIDHNTLVNSIITDPKALMHYKMATDETFGESLGMSFINQFNSMGAGISEIIDEYLPESVSDILNYEIGGEPTSVTTRKRERDDRMAKQNLEQNTRQLASPGSSLIGGSLPYILSDIALTPVASRVIGAAGKTLSAGGNLVRKGVNKADEAARAGAVGIEGAEQITRPLSNYVENIANRRATNPELAKIYEEVAQAPIKGAIEGGVDYNQTWDEGATASTLGQVLGSGSAATKMLGRVPVTLTAAQKEAAETGTRLGMRLTPGTLTGDKNYQTREMGFRTEPKTRNYMGEIDDHNDGILAEKALEIVGLKKNYRDLTRDDMSKHMNDLSRKYEALERTTVGRFEPDAFRRMEDMLDEARPGRYRRTSDDAKQRYRKLDNLYRQMRQDMQFPSQGAGGRFQSARFDGDKYQTMARRLKEVSDQAFADGDVTLQRHVKVLKDELDKSIETGLGSTKAKQWKDINEQYAMSKLLMESGLDANLGIDMQKLTNKLMSEKEAPRTLTRSGGSIRDLQDLATIHSLQSKSSGREGWSGSGVEQPDLAKQSLLRKTLFGHMESGTPATTRGLMNMYMAGYPSRTGLGILPRSAFAKGGRAAAMEGGTPERAEHAYDKYLAPTVKSTQDLLERLGKLIPE